MTASIWSPASTIPNPVAAGEIDVTAFPFLAQGNGVTDDTASFQAAIDYAELIIGLGLGGGRPVILVPYGLAGKFMTRNLVIRKRLKFKGLGSGTSFIKQLPDGTNPHFTIYAEDLGSGTSIEDSNHVMFEGLNLEGNRTGTGAATAAHGIYCVPTPSSQYFPSIETFDVLMTNYAGDAIHCGENRNWPFLTRTIARYNNGNGLSLYGYDGRITDCDFGQNEDIGVREYAGGGNAFKGVNIYGNDQNVVCNSTSNAPSIFESCFIDYAKKEGVVVDQATGQKIFKGCRFYGNSANGANLYSDVVVTGASADLKVTDSVFTYANQKVKYLIETASNPKVTFKDNSYDQVNNVPYQTDICNTPNLLHSDVFEVTGLVQNSSAAAASNGAIIRATIRAAAIARGNVKFPAGIYYTDKFQFYAYCDYAGAGEHATTLILGNGQNTDLVTDANYELNVAFASNPYSVHDLTLDGNNSNNTSGSVCIIQSYWCTFTNVTFQNGAEYGQVTTTKTKNGTNIANSVADNRFINCRFNGNKLGGHYGRDTANLLADQMFEGCIFSSNGISGAYQMVSERFIGYTLDDCRFYLSHFGDVDATKFSVSQIKGCHFELAGVSSPNTSTILASIRVRSWSGTGFKFSDIVTNTFWMNTTYKTATDIYCGVYFDQASEALNLTGNTFQTAPAITTKRAIHGAASMVGKCYPNTFLGYTAGTEYGTAWANWARPAITGSRGGNAALASLLTVLAAEGILTDSSTA